LRVWGQAAFRIKRPGEISRKNGFAACGIRPELSLSPRHPASGAIIIMSLI
jgi:hypothetical protein